MERELQSLPGDFFNLLHALALETGVVDQNVQMTPLCHSLLDNLPTGNRQLQLSLLK